MPWSLERRDSQWCVIKDSDGSSAGCHDSRADAIKQQRALYANESRMASIYAELDAQPDPEPPLEVVAQPALAASALSPLAAELVGLLLKDEREKSLVASMADSQSLISRQLDEAREDRKALVAALTSMGSPTINMPEPVVNVHVPEAKVDVHVPAPEVSVQAPDVHVNVPAANITVQPANVVMPEKQKTVTFERDPLTREITRAEVTEE